MASFLKQTIFLLCIGSSLLGKDLGTYGHTFLPEEEDFLSYLKEKFNCLSEEEKELIQKQIQEHYKNLTIEPSSVEHIQEATVYRQFYCDPTVTVNKDIKDHEGKIIVPIGTAYNPLSQMHYKSSLLFFDGSNEAHVSWAKKESLPSKWILVKGKPLALEESEDRPVFFDQRGVLSQWLGITKVPARVTQEGTKLKIEEIPLKEAPCD